MIWKASSHKSQMKSCGQRLAADVLLLILLLYLYYLVHIAREIRNQMLATYAL